MQAVQSYIFRNASSPGVVPLPVSNVGLRLFHHLPLPQEHLRLQLDITLSCENVCKQFKHSRKCPKDSIYTACTFLREHLDYLSQPHCKASNKSLQKRSFNTATGEKRFWLFVHRKYFSNSNCVARLQNILGHWHP